MNLRLGPELDAAVVERVMGWEYRPANATHDHPSWFDKDNGKMYFALPEFSKLWTPAMQAADKMIADNYSFGVSWYHDKGGTWYAEFHIGEEIWEECCDSGPHAICLAALAAKAAMEHE